MTAPAVAAYVNTYTSRTPYLTTAEWINAPTAVDITDLIPDGTQAQQLQALTDCIARASSWIDELCFQVLAATSDVQYGRYRVNRWGTVRVPLKYKPVLEVSAVQVGYTPSQMTALSSLADVAIYQSGVIEVPVWALTTLNDVWDPGFLSSGSRPIVQVSYVNGWPNTLTSSAATAGASTLGVTSALGIYPGTVLTVYDGASTEQVQVAPSYTLGALTLPLTAPLAFAHAAGVSVSSLPPKVKEAAILLTTALIQTRGNDAIILTTTEEPEKTSGEYGASAETIALAMDLLESVRRAW